ncbi:MAG: hypothetical protein IH945_07030 [Armatimonadetes bacterium]|nr:hypothetical protein [Armatimonadota bacterium]
MLTRVRAAEKVCRAILARHEKSTDRIISLDEARKNLAGLTIGQQDRLSSALGCVEHGFFAGAVIFSWAVFIDYLLTRFESDAFAKLYLEMPNWSACASREDLVELVTDYALVDAAKRVKLLTKAEMKSMHGLLSDRNQCAHPTGYDPDMNEAIGYVSRIIKTISTVENRAYPQS